MNLQPSLHWNNFTVPELKEILEHCTALESLGIAQDEDMICSIRRDIGLREKEISSQPYPLNHIRASQHKTKSPSAKKQPQEQLLEQII